MRFLNKNGQIGTETVIFIVLNILFFGSLLYFLFHSAGSAAIYEQAYAKQIALLIDNAKPDSTIYVNIDKLISIANSNGVRPENIVRIDEVNKRVIVSLVDKKGYSMQYYSDYSLALTSANIVRIYVKEKGAA